MNEDLLITLISEDRKIYGYIANVKNTTTALQKNHNMNIISSAIFGRALTSAVLLSGNLKHSFDNLSLKWSCSGDAKSIFVEVCGDGRVKGYIGENNLQLIERSLKDDSILSEPYIGFGDITLTLNSQSYKAPYSSVTVIETGEIAEDISLHIKQSLQIESAIKLGLLIDGKNNIDVCGGMLLLAMPDCDDKDIKLLHETFNKLSSLTDLLKETDNSLNEVNKYLSPLNLKVLNKREIYFDCNCNLEKIKSILKSLKKDELSEYLNKNNQIEANCQYCGKNYIINDIYME